MSNLENIASYIDHTLLKSDATLGQIQKLCEEAREFGFASVCVNPCYVKTCAELLQDSGVKTCTVVGFPLGTNTKETKAEEAARAIQDGAQEIDMVLNVGALKNGDDQYVCQDVAAVVDACYANGAICKVILETCLLTDEEKVRACQAVVKAGADFVKTSTGFSTGGATVADIELMSRTVAEAKLGVKASGGVRTLEDAQKMIAAGATRIGASAGVQIVRESRGETSAEGASGNY